MEKGGGGGGLLVALLPVVFPYCSVVTMASPGERAGFCQRILLCPRGLRRGGLAVDVRGGMAVLLVFKKPVPGMPQVGGGCACWAALPVGLWLASLGLYCSN